MLLHQTDFALDGLTPAAAAQLVTELAPQFARVPGLIHKIWIRDGDRFGGVYLWRDRASLDAMLGSPLDPATVDAFTDLRTRTFDVMDVPTAITLPSLTRS